MNCIPIHTHMLLNVSPFVACGRCTLYWTQICSAQPELVSFRWPDTRKGYVWGYPSWRRICWVLPRQSSFLSVLWIYSSIDLVIVARKTKFFGWSCLLRPGALSWSYLPEELSRKFWRLVSQFHRRGWRFVVSVGLWLACSSVYLQTLVSQKQLTWFPMGIMSPS